MGNVMQLLEKSDELKKRIDLGKQYSELRDAAESVVSHWKSGDLSRAIHRLDVVLKRVTPS